MSDDLPAQYLFDVRMTALDIVSTDVSIYFDNRAECKPLESNAGGIMQSSGCLVGVLGEDIGSGMEEPCDQCPEGSISMRHPNVPEGFQLELWLRHEGLEERKVSQLCGSTVT